MPGDEPSQGTKPTGPVLPDSALTPATGTFTDNEKKYLSGRVPQQSDPAAVLQAGHDACQHLELIAKRDKQAASVAIITGEIANTRDAIPHLCPDLKPVLTAAEEGLSDGTHKSPAPGTYNAVDPAPGCTWQAKGKDGAVLATGPTPTAQSGTTATAKIPNGTAEFVSESCNAWLRAQSGN
ncbi:hypothetical protein ABZ891_37750 [Streptomyces sp. NPDC047023]|uniref:hypothetical protein n=1 Tax=Streptomyces sp. NPDC047023 TaxID=3155139 RepID=UPI0033CAB70E